jgi:formate C-acetyltransferase
LVTEAYKETEGQPKILRRAKAHEKIVTELSIYIDDDQLLVGDFASKPMAYEWWPELTVRWVGEVLESGGFPYRIEPDKITQMKEIVEYWKDREAKESFMTYIGEDMRNTLNAMNENGSLAFFAEVEAQTEKGWHVPNYPKVMKIGLTGIITEIDEELSKTELLDNDSYAKINFLRALKISCQAGIRYAKRYAALAKELAEKSEGQRKKELERIADTCGWVLEKPARNFRDAMQTMLFCHLLIFWDVRLSGISFGRVDQFLYPYYKQDIENGTITREEALELLECFRVKLSSMRQFDSKITKEARSGETQFHNCTLGGQLTDGTDAVNEMSFLWIEAAERVRTPHPTLTVRWHPGLNPDFAMKVAELNRLGLGFPAWYCDETSISYLKNRGVTHEDAMNYVVSGCVLHTIPHKSASAWPAIVNLPKILEITMNNGVDPRLGTKIGLETGHLYDFKTLDELLEAFKKQVSFFTNISKSYLNHVRVFRAHELPNLFISALFDDCIQRGDGVFGGGAYYQQSSMYMLPVGVVDVGDSFAAMKKYLFEECSIGSEELLKALKVNFEGKEDLHKKLLDAPKFGNDIEYVDYIVRDIYSFLIELMNSIKAPYGSVYEVAPHSLSFHGAAGRRVGALPSGRLAGVALSDGACSPSQGRDVNGPTAVINSAGRIDHTPIYGTLFNMKFHPSALETKDDLEKFLAFIKTYFGTLKGKHIQFNVVDRETLLDAQKHPERHRNLIVRVAGYSALWVELDEKIQNEILTRTAHGA